MTREPGHVRALIVAALALSAANAWFRADVEHAALPDHTARYAGTVLGDVQSPEADAASFAFALDGGPAVLVHARHAAADWRARAHSRQVTTI